MPLYKANLSAVCNEAYSNEIVLLRFLISNTDSYLVLHIYDLGPKLSLILGGTLHHVHRARLSEHLLLSLILTRWPRTSRPLLSFNSNCEYLSVLVQVVMLRFVWYKAMGRRS